jgi:hypothetical protein
MYVYGSWYNAGAALIKKKELLILSKRARKESHILKYISNSLRV